MPHPLAVGVPCLPGALADRRRRARLQIALRAHAVARLGIPAAVFVVR